MNPIVIIGTGLASYTLAREFRKRNQETPLHIITGDDGSSYSKPMLSNALLKNKTPKALVMADAEKMAADLNACLWTNTWVHSIDRESHTLETDKGPVQYSQLVLAIGADPIKLPIEGDAADKVISVNDLQDYRIFRSVIEDAKRIAIIGAGLIGCEFANDLSSADLKIDVIDLAERPLGRLLPEQAARMLKDALSDLGVQWHLGTAVSRIDQENDYLNVQLQSGKILQADVVLSAVGLRPRIQMAREAGLKVDRGIQVDRMLRTSDPDIFALGDCAQVEDLLLPFVMPLMNSARALAATLAGEPTSVSYPAMPVVVKTPAHAVVVCPPPRLVEGRWEEEVVGNGVRALYKDEEGELLGFSLTGDAVSEKMALTRELEAWLG